MSTDGSNSQNSAQVTSTWRFLDEELKDNLKPLDVSPKKKEKTTAVLFRKEDIPVVTTKITSILSFLYEKYKIAEAVQPRDHIWQLLVQDSGGSPKVYTQAFIRMVNGNVRLEDNPNIGKAVDCWIIFDTYYNFNFCRQINVQQSDATRFRLKADSEPWNSIAKKHNSSALN